MKMKFTALCMLLFYVWSGVVHGQNFTQRKEFRLANSHWFTRDGNRMYDMRTIPPTVTHLPPSVDIGESGSGICDTATGDLLFYSSGMNIYNRNHEVMPNGIVGNGLSSGSTIQQLCIVPFIDTPGKYHVFNLMSFEQPDGLYYCVVDMNLDNGLGDVDTTIKEQLLYDGPLHEGMVAIPGNNCDVWVLVHPYLDSIFLAYHITAEGVDTVPVISSPGTVIYDADYSFEMGGMSVSPQRDKLAISSFSAIPPCGPFGIFGDTTSGGVMMAKFDPETGVVSTGVKVEHYVLSHSHCFSPNGNKLYVSGIGMDSSFGFQMSDPTHLYQYDVSNFSQTSIMSSKFDLAEIGILPGLRRFGDSILLTNYTYVPSPDFSGLSSGYSNISNYFAPETGSDLNWGNDVVYPLPATNLINIKDTIVCAGVSLKLEATKGYHTYRWNTGGEDAELTITTTGTYWVEYQKFCHTGVDTFHIDLLDFPEPIITVNERDLSTSEAYDTYQWMLDGAVISGATARVYTVKENGNYQVVASRGDCIDTSAPYRVNNATGLNNWEDETSVRVYPNPASTVINIESVSPVEIVVIGVEGKVYKKEYGVSQIAIHDLADGLYLIEIKNADGKLLQIEKVVKSAQP